MADKARWSCIILPFKLSRYLRSTTECACLARMLADSSSLSEGLCVRLLRDFLSPSAFCLDRALDSFEIVLDGDLRVVFCSTEDPILVDRHGGP